MTPEQFTEALARLSLSRADAARQLGVTRGAVTLWAQGKRPIPGTVVELIRLWLSKEETE